MESQNIIIRKFQNADSLKVCNIIRRNLIEINSKDYPIHIINNMCELYSPDNMIKMANVRNIYVAELNRRIIGTGSLEDNIVCGVYVDMDFQKHGVGSKLISCIEDNAKKNFTTPLQAYASLTALNFYYVLGYKYVKDVDDSDSGRSTLVEKQLF